jgi:hypothetical protein
MEGLLTSAGGSACTMQASCASLPSPEWTQPLSTSISGASAQQNGLVSQELMQADVHNAHSRYGGSTPGLFRIWDTRFCSPRGLKHSADSQLTAYIVRTAVKLDALQSLLFPKREFVVCSMQSGLFKVVFQTNLIYRIECQDCYDSKVGKDVELSCNVPCLA